MKTSILDISRFQDTLPIIEVNGRVRYYSQRLLIDSDFDEKGETHEAQYDLIASPSGWPQNPDKSYGTYQILLKGLKSGSTYGFFFMDALSSFKASVDGTVIYSNGVVSESEKIAIPESKPGSGYFIAQKPEATLLIQMSNHTAHLTGLWQKLVFSSADQINTYHLNYSMRNTFILSVLLIMAIYHWILYAIMRKDAAIFYFSLFTSMVMIKSAFSDMQLGYTLYPYISHLWGLKLAYLSIPVAVYALLGFVSHCFPSEVNRTFIKLSSWFSFAQVIVILFSQQAFF